MATTRKKRQCAFCGRCLAPKKPATGAKRRTKNVVKALFR